MGQPPTISNRVTNHVETDILAAGCYLALVVLEFPVAVKEVRLLDLWNSLAVFWVGETPPVKLTLSLPCFLVYFGHDALDQRQLSRTKVAHGAKCLQLDT